MDSSSTSSRAHARQALTGSNPPPMASSSSSHLGAGAVAGSVPGLPHASSYPLMDNFLAAAQAQVSNPASMYASLPNTNAVQAHQQPMRVDLGSMNRPNLPNMKVNRFKGKRQYPSIPNQPSESSAYFMFELAKMVLNKAGGTSSTSLFTQPSANQDIRGPHRALHMAAFQIGLYALGLHNSVSPNWLSRTYSSHVSWITGTKMTF